MITKKVINDDDFCTLRKSMIPRYHLRSNFTGITFRFLLLLLLLDLTLVSKKRKPMRQTDTGWLVYKRMCEWIKIQDWSLRLCSIYQKTMTTEYRTFLYQWKIVLHCVPWNYLIPYSICWFKKSVDENGFNAGIKMMAYDWILVRRERSSAWICFKWFEKRFRYNDIFTEWVMVPLTLWM